MKFRLSVFLIATFLLMTRAVAAPVDSDERFLAARDAARAGDRAKLELIAPELQGHDLVAFV